ncbi:MAG: (d)CMP kinase [Clostridia bacterium]|nr:(d)CMP kinase [Clostridia bacterium]
MIQIAIDGYSGSGKGELSKGLSEKLNLKHLDTGAILRSMGLYFHSIGITEITSEIIDAHYDKLNIKIEFDGDRQITYLNNQDVSTAIRTEVVGQMASRCAAIPKAMQKLIDISQEFASKYDCVLDGRNITSEVLPDADVKIFLDASPECRAKRRYNELLQKGIESDYDTIYESLKERDYRDTHREFSKMYIVEDAFVVDNSNMTIEETINHCYNHIEKVLKEKGKI